MDLNYITQLKEEEFVALINFCIQKQNERYQEEGIGRDISPIKQAVIYDETDRKDMKGNRYVWVCTADGLKVLSSYRVRDFEMTLEDMGQYGSHAALNYTSDMRIFMTKRFGKDYVKALYQYQVSEAEKELERLSIYIEDQKQM